MDILVLTFLFSIPLVASFTANSQPLYFESICGRSNGYLSIRYPFRIVNIEPKSIGYPGFDLYCDPFNNTLLQLPNSGNFSVQVIDYKKQQIVLTDPNDCLAQKLLLDLDLSHTPFRFIDEYYFYEFSFYNCSEKNENYTEWRKEKISCLSTVPNHAIIGGDPGYIARSLEPWCDVVGNVRLPSYVETKFSRFGAQLLLAWDKPSCGLCEGNVTRCVFKNDTSLETVCVGYDTPIAESRQQLSTKARYAIGFSVGLGVPAILVLILILYKKIRSHRRAAANRNDGSPVV